MSAVSELQAAAGLEATYDTADDIIAAAELATEAELADIISWYRIMRRMGSDAEPSWELQGACARLLMLADAPQARAAGDRWLAAQIIPRRRTSRNSVAGPVRAVLATLIAPGGEFARPS